MPRAAGTKAAVAFPRRCSAPAAPLTFRLRLTNVEMRRPFDNADAIVARARNSADTFYADLQRDIADADARLVQRQALAGMIWSKQFYHYDVRDWLAGDPAMPPPPAARRHGRNADWRHVNTADILSMPDKWEYPWFAAWDSAFHCLPLALVDPEFAKGQLVLADPGVVHPSQRPVAGLRVELRRRQSAGARLGGLAGLQDRRQPARRPATSGFSSGYFTSCF